MAKVRFLATTRDLRPGKEGTVYGRGHETDFDQDDYEFVMSLWSDGRGEIYDWSGITPPGEVEPPPEEPPAA